MRPERSTLSVGFLVLAALAALAVVVFMIGEENNLFRPMNRYSVRLENVGGLQAGNPVQLNGVDVGRVEEIVLPRDPSEHLLTVKILVDQRFARRVRRDSQARIKTLGLLGDKFVEITSGSDEAVVTPDGGEIDAAPATNVDRLIASGEDAVQNIVSISVNLAKILDRLERGEGVLGQLMAPIPEGERQRNLVQTLRGALDAVDRISSALEEGSSPLSRLLLDERMGASLASTVERLDAVSRQAVEGEGMVPWLLSDPAPKERIEQILAGLEQSSASLATASRAFESGDGLLPRLLHDQAYADQVTGELESLLQRLNSLAEQISEGDGTAGRLIQDPQVYEAINDVIVGINESKLLRWLIRNRQKAGIEKRYRQERAAQAQGADGVEDGAPAGPGG